MLPGYLLVLNSISGFFCSTRNEIFRPVTSVLGSAVCISFSCMVECFYIDLSSLGGRGVFSCLLLSIYSVYFSSQRHGYCTLGEAFNRLDFSSAIQDIRRFNYVVKVSSLF